jgi:hypothetical protein
MTFNTRDFLTCIIAFVFSTIGIFYTLGINDAKTRFDVASLSGTSLTNLIFLMPALAGSLPLLASHSTAKSNDVPFSISENHSATSAIGNHFSVGKALHKIHRINQLGVGASSFAHFPIVHESVQTVLD